jgi:hypothetical protein
MAVHKEEESATCAKVECASADIQPEMVVLAVQPRYWSAGRP